MRNLLILLISLVGLIGYYPSVTAQTSSNDQSEQTLIEKYRYLIRMNRAKNLARQAAEAENGGLSQYRAEPAMHGPVHETNHEQIDEGAWRFRIKGRRPGESDFTMETVVKVNTNTNTVTVESNRSIQ